MFKLLTLSSMCISVVLLLSACSTTLPVPTPQAVPMAAYEKNRTLVPMPVGSLIELPEENPMGQTHARLVSEYHAASGYLCRRVVSLSNSGDMRVICKRSNGQWTFTRALQSQALLRPLEALTLVSDLNDERKNGLNEDVKSHLSEREHGTEPQTVGKHSADSVELVDAYKDNVLPFIRVKLNRNETLWTFAERTTGNPLNWTYLAQINKLANARHIASGALLKVPEKLYLAEH